MKSVYFITVQKKHIIRTIIFLLLTILFILLISTFASMKKGPSLSPKFDTEVVAHLQSL